MVTRSTLTYWAMTAFQGMFWEQRSWNHPKMLIPLAVQWGFAVVASVLAIWQYRRSCTSG